MNYDYKIYMPDDNALCYVVQSEGVIRAYEQIPTNNSTVDYRDYYINSNYIFREGSQTFSQYTSLPACLNNDIITHDPYYRNDFSQILIIFAIIAVFCIFIPFKILFRLFRRFN